jgi:hypothetical protein
MTKMAFSVGGDGGRRSPELPLACFSFVMLAARAGTGSLA